MDRFIDDDERFDVLIDAHLKSNMDRFIATRENGIQCHM